MAEKFRPRQISDVIGQDNIKNMVRRSLRNKTFPQFSIMYGPSGTGKSTMAEICGLSITCMNPDNGEPCCQCKSCMDNLKLLNEGKSSYNLVKINMGAIERTDFKQTIKEVFTLSPAIGDSAVYIFEEIQALTKDEQNILLEYVSGMAKNIYVIACTTELMKLRTELRNRAIKFQFKQIRTEDAMQLIERVCTEKMISRPSVEISKYLARSTGNCPREIVNLIDFLSDAQSLNDQAMSEFLGYVHNIVYIQYFEKCKCDAYEFNQWLDTLQETGYINVLRGIRNFTIDCYGYVFGSNTVYFNTHEKHQIKEIFAGHDEESLLNIMHYFDECKFDDEISARYCLIAGRRFFMGKSVGSVLKESKREASKAVIQSEHTTRKVEKSEARPSKIMDMSELDDLLAGMTRVRKSSPQSSEATKINISDITDTNSEEITKVEEEEEVSFESLESLAEYSVDETDDGETEGSSPFDEVLTLDDD